MEQMTKTSTTLQRELHDLKMHQSKVMSDRREEHRKLVEERTFELRKQICAIESKVAEEMASKYADGQKKISEEIIVKERELDEARIKEAEEIWHPVGTEVEEWEVNTRIDADASKAAGGERVYRYSCKRTGRRGVVEIYTNESADTYRYKGHVGSKMIRLKKKDGSMGKECINITNYTGNVQVDRTWKIAGEQHPLHGQLYNSKR